MFGGAAGPFLFWGLGMGDRQPGKLVLVTGGARSGKSRFALDLAREAGGRLAFLATARPGDPEMEARIARHRAERGDGWLLVEEPNDPAGALSTLGAEAVVLDCLTLWVSNRMEMRTDEEILEEDVPRLLGAAGRFQNVLVVVTNEVGLGVVPATPLGRRFRDIAGLVNQRFAGEAEEVHVLWAGIPHRLK